MGPNGITLGNQTSLTLTADVTSFGAYTCTATNTNGFVTAKGYISPSNIPYFNINRIYRFGGGGCEFVHTLLPLLNISKDYEKTDILIIHIYSSTLTKKPLKTIILSTALNSRNLMMKNLKKNPRPNKHLQPFRKMNR